MSEQKLKEERKEEYDDERRRRELEKKKIRKEKEERKVEKAGTAKQIIQKTPETKVRIPVLELEKPKIEIKEISLSKEIPQIEKEKLEVRVPIVQLTSPTFEEKEIRVNKEIPSVEPIEKRALKIPLVKLRESPVKTIISEFNSTIPTVRPKLQAGVSVPIYRILRTAPVREIALLDEKIDEKLLERPEEKRIQTIEDRVSSVSKGAEPSSGGEKEIEEEPPEILKSVFGVSKNSLFSSRAKLIWVSVDEFLGSVAYICWRIYREIKGGKAEPRIISNASKESFKREIENWMKAEDKVFSVEFKKDEELDKVFWESFLDRIEELFGQGIGFIVTNEKIFFKPRHHGVDCVDINIPEKLVVEEKKESDRRQAELLKAEVLQAELSSLMWGFVTPKSLLKKTKEKYGQIKFDYIFGIGKELFEGFEGKIKSIGEPYHSVTKRHRSLNESDDMHYPLKVFVVKYIANMLELKGVKDVDRMKHFIHTEEEIEGIYPDIHVDASADAFAHEVFEIETLFGEGEYSMKKIDETVEKYEKIGNPPAKVNVVLENLTFLMHLKEIVEKKRIHENLKSKRERNFELEFWTIDIQNNRLVSLEEVLRRVKSLYRKLSKN